MTTMTGWGRGLTALACAVALSAALACGGDDGNGSDSTTGAGASGAGTAVSSTTGAGGFGPGGFGAGGFGTGGEGNASPASTGAGGSSSAGTGGTGAGSTGLADVSSLVVLGDSISDGGGQSPYYYNLLRNSLEAFYGKTLQYNKKAQSGSKTSALLGQVNGLPNMLPGPVVVTITSGGNDMKDNLPAILAGLDASARQQMGNNIDAALDALLAPGRFGAGVEVHVFFANIYDASDGQGNFATGGCNINVNSPSSTDPFFANWNGEIAMRLSGQGETLADMHGHFYGHGFNNPPKWYANDCTHPNSTGHAEIENMFYGLITGQ